MVNPILLAALLIVPAAAECTTIQDGLFYPSGHYLEGEPLVLGYDAYGFNYQAHMFRGNYANYLLGWWGYPPFEGDRDAYLAENPGASWVLQYYANKEVIFKWNDADTSNKDCDGDGLLDEHYMEKGSGAWWMETWWYMEDGKKTGSWTAKYVTVPEDAYRCGYLNQWWCDAGGNRIGYAAANYAVIQEDWKDFDWKNHWVWKWGASAGLGRF